MSSDTKSSRPVICVFLTYLVIDNINAMLGSQITALLSSLFSLRVLQCVFHHVIPVGDPVEQCWEEVILIHDCYLPHDCVLLLLGQGLFLGKRDGLEGFLGLHRPTEVL